VQFDGKLKLEFHGAKMTSDSGLLSRRERDEAFRLTEKTSTVLSDPRPAKNTQHTMPATLRLSVYRRPAGCEDVNDAERSRIAPAMRRFVGGRAKESEAASTSELSRLETEIPTPRKNQKAMMDLSGKWVDRVRQRRSLDKLILDLNSSVSETYGRRERPRHHIRRGAPSAACRC
jgi:hypothetical protein